MIHKIYTVYDAKAEAYLTPFFAMTNGLALRSFSDAVKDPEHPFCKYAEDYTLFLIGEYDDKTGIATGYETHDPMSKAINLKV